MKEGAHDPLPCEAGTALRPADWYASYQEAPRRDIGGPQPALRALAETGAIGGRVLDVGCGTGEHALMCAAMGLDALGVDVSAVALRIAAGKAKCARAGGRFVALDVRRLAELGETFDTVLDSGLFVHVYDDPAAYLAGCGRCCGMPR